MFSIESLSREGYRASPVAGEGRVLVSADAASRGGVHKARHVLQVALIHAALLVDGEINYYYSSSKGDSIYRT